MQKMRKVWVVGERKPVIQSTDKHGKVNYRRGKNGGICYQQVVELHHKYS